MKQVWDLTGRKLYNFEGHDAPVYSVCPHHKENIQVCLQNGESICFVDQFVISVWKQMLLCKFTLNLYKFSHLLNFENLDTSI